MCNHVLEDNPIMLFVHDSDGDIQFMCGASRHATEEVRVVGIVELVEHLRSIANMPTVDPGFLAERFKSGGEWDVQPIET